MIIKLKKTLCDPSILDTYLSAFPVEERAKKEAEMKASIAFVSIALDKQAAETDQGSTFFKCKPGDIELYADICPDKIIVETPKKVEDIKEDSDGG
jgi:hypothetical protein